MTDHTARSETQLGAILRRVRKQRGLTQAEVGEKTRLRQATISTLEDGAPATRLRTLMLTLAALDLELVVRQRTRSSVGEIGELF